MRLLIGQARRHGPLSANASHVPTCFAAPAKQVRHNGLVRILMAFPLLLQPSFPPFAQPWLFPASPVQNALSSKELLHDVERGGSVSFHSVAPFQAKARFDGAHELFPFSTLMTSERFTRKSADDCSLNAPRCLECASVNLLRTSAMCRPFPRSLTSILPNRPAAEKVRHNGIVGFRIYFPSTALKHASCLSFFDFVASG